LALVRQANLIVSKGETLALRPSPCLELAKKNKKILKRGKSATKLGARL